VRTFRKTRTKNYFLFLSVAYKIKYITISHVTICFIVFMEFLTDKYIS